MAMRRSALCYPVCSDAVYASCSQQKALFNLFLWLFSKSIPLKEYYPLWSLEAPMWFICLCWEKINSYLWFPLFQFCLFLLQLRVRCRFCWLLLEGHRVESQPHFSLMFKTADSQLWNLLSSFPPTHWWEEVLLPSFSLRQEGLWPDRQRPPQLVSVPSPVAFQNL